MYTYYKVFVGFSLGDNYSKGDFSEFSTKLSSLFEEFDIDSIDNLKLMSTDQEFVEEINKLNIPMGKIFIDWLVSDDVKSHFDFEYYYHGGSEKKPYSLIFNKREFEFNDIGNNIMQIGDITKAQSYAVNFYEFCGDTMPKELIRFFSINKAFGLHFMEASS